MIRLLALILLLASTASAQAQFIPNRPDATFDAQARPTSQDFSILAAGGRNGVVYTTGTDCAVTAQGSPDMTVAVAPCTTWRQSAPVAVTGGNSAIAAADPTHPRFDLVSTSNLGAVVVTTGTPNAQPVPPAIPTSGGAANIVLATVYVAAGDTAIPSNRITDKRYFVSIPANPGATYLVRTPDSALPNATAMAGLGTGLVLNTTGTGMPTIYAGSGACPAGDFISALSASGVKTCGTPAGGGGSAFAYWIDPTRSPYNAVGDGKVATDCSMTNGSAVLTCGTNQFVSGDVGKVIAVYGAGPLSSGYRQPLSTTISAFTSATQVTLAATASATVANSERTLWGTNNTAAIQAAVDALAASDGQGGNIGGILQLPAGHFLLTTVTLPCARVGTFIQGTCTLTYNNIWIRGAGLATTVENWDIASANPLFLVATKAEVGESGNARLTGFRLSDMTLRQVSSATSWETKHVIAYATENVTIQNLHVRGGSYEGLSMGGSGKSHRWVVSHNLFEDVGVGGPANPGTALSCANMNGRDWIVFNNIFRCPFAIEAGSVRGLVIGNQFDGRAYAPLPGAVIEFGSTGSGIWDNTVYGNVFLNSRIGHGNVLGTANRLKVIGNTFHDSAVRIRSGLSTNSLITAGDEDAVVHGTSYVQSNAFLTTSATPGYPIEVGGGGTAYQDGLENVIIANNTVTLHTGFIEGGANAGTPCFVDADSSGGPCMATALFLALNNFGVPLQWKPSTAYALHDLVIPTVPNGYYYRVTTAGTSGSSEPTWPTTITSTVNDNGTVWTTGGKRPTVTASHNVLRAPAGLRALGAVSFRGTWPETATLIGNAINVLWRLECQNALPDPRGCGDDVVGGPNTMIENAAWWSGTKMPFGYYRLGDTLRWSTLELVGITVAAQSRGTRQSTTVVREGRGAPTWATATAYGYGNYVVPTSDNGHFYYQTVAAGCTSDGSTEPSFPTGAGATVNDNTCTWKEAGTAVLWDDVQDVTVGSTATLLPLAALMRLTCTNGGGCAMTLDETGARDTQRVDLLNVSANNVTIADSAGVQEIANGGTATLGQYEMIRFQYITDRWVEIAR